MVSDPTAVRVPDRIPFQRPTSWGADLRRDMLLRELTQAQWKVIHDLLQAAKAETPGLGAITRAQFSHPAIDGTLAEIRDAIRSGCGAVILRGFPVAVYDLLDTQRIYLGIGRHLGTPNSQNTRGDIIGHVTDKRSGTFGQKDRQGQVVLRGYENNSELELHSDAADIAALLCVRKAKSGGMSSIADALKVYEILASDFPSELVLLEQGWPAHRRNEETPGQPKVTPYNVPAFGWTDGLLSCKKNTIAAHGTALEALGRGWLDDASLAALQCFDAVAARPDVRSDIQLEPGEILYLNNFEFLHARTNYEDWEDESRKRLLLRLWLEFDPPRPIDPHMLTFENPSGMKGIDKVNIAGE